MDKGTVLYIEVPLEDLVFNSEGDLHLLKKHWHEHINFYSEKSLYHLVKNVGLEIKELKIMQETAGGKSYNLFQIACKLLTK